MGANLTNTHHTAFPLQGFASQAFPLLLGPTKPPDTRRTEPVRLVPTLQQKRIRIPDRVFVVNANVGAERHPPCVTDEREEHGRLSRCEMRLCMRKHRHAGRSAMLGLEIVEIALYPGRQPETRKSSVGTSGSPRLRSSRPPSK